MFIIIFVLKSGHAALVYFLLFFVCSSNGFGKTKTSAQLNSLEKVIDRSTAGGDGSYRLQSLMVLHVMVISCCKLWFLQKAAWNSMEQFLWPYYYYQYSNIKSCLVSVAPTKVLKESDSRSQFSLKRSVFRLIRRLSLLRFNYFRCKYRTFI